MKELPLQHKYIELLESLGLPYLHIPNRAFGKFKTPGCLKDFPDLMFAYNGRVYQREFGVSGRHLERKQRQLAVMTDWASNGNVNILIINNEDGLKEDWKKIGLGEVSKGCDGIVNT